MANIIDETENVLILTVMIAIILFAAWIYFKIKGDPGSGFTNPENPYYGLNERNIKGWLDYFWPGLFPEVEAHDPDWTDQDEALVDSYQPNVLELQQAVQNGPSIFEKWLNSLSSNPGNVTIGNSPLF